MAIDKAQQCAYPQNLDYATKQLLEYIGDTYNDLINQMDVIIASQDAIDTELDKSTDALNRILAKGSGSGITDVNAVSENFGIPKQVQTTTEDEKYLFYSGLVIVAGVIYADGKYSPLDEDKDNIEVLRKIYFACGRDFNKAKSIYAATKTKFLKNYIKTSTLVPGKYRTLSLTEIKRKVYPTYVNEKFIVKMPDNNILVQTQSFMTEDVTILETKRRFNVSNEYIKNDVVHVLSVANNSAAIKEYTRQGFNNVQLSAILSGQSYVDNQVSPLSEELAQIRYKGKIIIGDIEKIQSSALTLSSSQVITVKNRLNTNLKELLKLLKNAMSLAIFDVNTIVQTTTIASLLDRNSDSEIIHLLEDLPEVKGIYLNAPDDLLLRLIQASTGTTTVSNNFLNTQTNPKVDLNILLQMQSDVVYCISLIDFISDIKVRVRTLINMKNQLEIMITRDPTGTLNTTTTTTTNIPLQGQMSAVSSASMIIEQADIQKSFKLVQKLGNIDVELNKLLNKLSDKTLKPIAAVISTLSGIISNVLKTLDEAVAKMKKSILPFKKKLEAFYSQYLSLIGSGEFETSLFKCAIDFNISLTFPIIDELLALIDNLVSLIREYVEKLAKMISDMLEKLLCLPINLINSLIGSIDATLPSICTVQKVNLGPELEDALKKLRALCTYHQTLFSVTNRDLLRFRAMVSSAPDKLSQFKNSSICNSSQAQNFLNVAFLNINTGITNPLSGGVSGAIGKLF